MIDLLNYLSHFMVHRFQLIKLNWIHCYLISQYHSKNLYFYLSMMIILLYFATIQESHLHLHLALPPTCIHLATLLSHLLLSSLQTKLKILLYCFMLKFSCFQKFGCRSDLVEERKVAFAEHLVIKFECLGWKFGRESGLKIGLRFGFLREGFGMRTGSK